MWSNGHGGGTLDQQSSLLDAPSHPTTVIIILEIYDDVMLLCTETGKGMDVQRLSDG